MKSHHKNLTLLTFTCLLVIGATLVSQSAFAQPRVTFRENKEDKKSRLALLVNMKTFTSDFEKACKRKLSEEKYNNFNTKYRPYLYPAPIVSAKLIRSEPSNSESISLFIDATTDGIERPKKAKELDFSQFKSESKNKKRITKLYESKQVLQRRLAYMLIGAFSDSSYLSSLRIRLQDEKHLEDKEEAEDVLLCLLSLRDDHVSNLFNAFNNTPQLGIERVLPLFQELDSDSLYIVSLQRISSESVPEKTLAAACLSVTVLDEKSESALKQALSDWDDNHKQYPLRALSDLESGGLLSVIEPHISNESLRELCYMALSRSSSEEDRQYLIKSCAAEGALESSLTNSLASSTHPDLLIAWLKLISEGRATVSEEFYVEDHPLLWSDPVLPHIIATINKCEDHSQSARIVPALGFREDGPVLSVLAALLTSDSPEIRRAAISGAYGKTNKSIHSGLLRALSQPSRLIELVDCIIEYPIDSLQAVFANIMMENPKGEWNLAGFKYLAAFPLDEHRPLFESIMQSISTEFSYVRLAKRGLINLGDELWAETVIIQLDGGRHVLSGKDARKFREIQEKKGLDEALNAFMNELDLFRMSPGY